MRNCASGKLERIERIHQIEIPGSRRCVPRPGMTERDYAERASAPSIMATALLMP